MGQPSVSLGSEPGTMVGLDLFNDDTRPSGHISHPPGTMGQPSVSLGSEHGTMGQPSASLGSDPGTMGQCSVSLGSEHGSMGQPSASLGSDPGTMGATLSQPRIRTTPKLFHRKCKNCHNLAIIYIGTMSMVEPMHVQIKMMNITYYGQ